MKAESKTGMNRRDFFRTAQVGGAVALGTAMASGAGALAPENKTISQPGKLPEVAFGKTGHTLPMLAHGGSAMIASDIAKYGLKLIPLEDRIKMVRHGYDSGIRYFDTARIYGESESILREALKDVRDDVFINSKVLVMHPNKVRESVEKSLEELGTDYVDSMQIHGPTVERVPHEMLMEMHGILEGMRDEGMIRFIGLTGHSRFDKMHALIETGGFDTLLIEAGYIRKGYNTRHGNQQLEWQQLCLDAAHERGMGVLAMKVLGAWVFNHNSGKMFPDAPAEELQALPGAAMRWAAQDPRIDLLLMGISFPKDIDRNLEILSGDLTCTAADRQLLARYAAKAYDHETLTELKLV